MSGVAFTTANERGQTDAALVRRFRQAATKRARAAAFGWVVREHRDAVLGRCAARLWPDADAAVAAARDVFLVAYVAMRDPAKLARPDRLRDWLLGIVVDRGLASGLPARADAVNWEMLQAGIADDEPDKPDVWGSATLLAAVRHWLEQIVATLPEPRQQMYDVFVRRALDSRGAATELGTYADAARRLRRENREAILRAFEVTALAAAEPVDPRDDTIPGCRVLRQLLADGLGDRGMFWAVRRDGVVLPADLRLAVSDHMGHCGACADRRADCTAQWAPELLPVLAGAELDEQVIDDLRTIPEPARPRRWGPGGARSRRRAGVVALVGLVVVLLPLGFVRPGFLLSGAASAQQPGSSPEPTPAPSTAPPSSPPTPTPMPTPTTTAPAPTPSPTAAPVPTPARSTAAPSTPPPSATEPSTPAAS